ncbi:hypothetical protein QL285_061124 [Trifolium repens]|nr:hypothetical protein QL285_061124 [Trifolium repens]
MASSRRVPGETSQNVTLATSLRRVPGEKPRHGEQSLAKRVPMFLGNMKNMLTRHGELARTGKLCYRVSYINPYKTRKSTPRSIKMITLNI